MPDGTLIRVAFAGSPYLTASLGHRAHLPVVGDSVRLSKPMTVALEVDAEATIRRPFVIVGREFVFPVLGPDAGAMVCCLLLEDPPADGEEGDA